VIGTPRGREGDDRGVTNGLFEATFHPAFVLVFCLRTIHSRLRETYGWNDTCARGGAEIGRWGDFRVGILEEVKAVARPPKTKRRRADGG
jgi:hypothetical protein